MRRSVYDGLLGGTARRPRSSAVSRSPLPLPCATHTPPVARMIGSSAVTRPLAGRIHVSSSPTRLWMYGSRLATTTTRTPLRRSLRSETRRSRDHSLSRPDSEGNHLAIACLNDRASQSRVDTGCWRLQKLIRHRASTPPMRRPNCDRFRQSPRPPCPYPGQTSIPAANGCCVPRQTDWASGDP